jgi:hypothetical protein
MSTLIYGNVNSVPGTAVPFNVDTGGGIIAAIPATVVNGQKTVTAAGTAEALGAATTLYSGVSVKALATNTNDIYVGSSAVDDTNGYVLSAGEAVFVENGDLANIFIDADTNSEGVSFVGG